MEESHERQKKELGLAAQGCGAWFRVDCNMDRGFDGRDSYAEKCTEAIRRRSGICSYDNVCAIGMGK
jgi:hypothetical protein